MLIDGIDFNVKYWKGKTEKQFIAELVHAYPAKDLKNFYKALMQEMGEIKGPLRIQQNNEESEKGI